jgi:hypothetical protein
MILQPKSDNLPSLQIAPASPTKIATRGENVTPVKANQYASPAKFEQYQSPQVIQVQPKVEEKPTGSRTDACNCPEVSLDLVTMPDY